VLTLSLVKPLFVFSMPLGLELVTSGVRLRGAESVGGVGGVGRLSVIASN
jgi:hypothetical protein